MLLLCGALFLLFLLSSCFLLYRVKYARMIELTKDWPSPPTLPIIGHGHYFINKPPEEFLKTFKNFFETLDSKSMKLWLGPELNLIIGDVRDVESILGTTRINDKAGEYIFLESWLRQGLLISRGKKWHQRRKILTPAFHFKILEQFIDVFERESRLLVNNFEKELKMQTEAGIQLYVWVNLCTLDTICGETYYA